MLKKSLIVSGLCLAVLLTALPVAAQEPATIVLRSGERISGELVDLGGAGFTIRVNGQDRTIDSGQVAAVEFVGGSPNADVQGRLKTGRPVVVLRNGEVIEGSLFDIGGTHPLRVTLNTPGGERNVTSNDVAQIYYANSTGAVGTTGPAPGSDVPAGDIRVEANRPWTDSGITVERGERLMVNARGDIMLGTGLSSGVNGTPAVNTGNYPVKTAPAGALIARVGNSAPFLIGSQTEVTMPASGRLFLGVNDDQFQDNVGYWAVGVARQAGRRR
jgi:hypothetical protein